MPVPTLIATPGDPAANSYATVAQADAYHDTLPHRDDWAATGSDADAKTVALISATRLLDSLFVWANFPTHPETQALQWPRSGMLKRGGWVTLPDNAIPAELVNATAEFARQLITADRTADSDVETQGLTALSVGSISLAFKDSVTAKVVPDAVVNLIPPEWGYRRGSGRSIPLYRT